LPAPTFVWLQLYTPSARVARRCIFRPKLVIWVNFWSVLRLKILVYFMEIWSILWPFDIFYGQLAYFVVILYTYITPFLVYYTKKNLAILPSSVKSRFWNLLLEQSLKYLQKGKL
jgi:hypothetical protein